jgi:hypothetical protein
LWAYWPVRNVAREGQQSGHEAKLDSNVTPSSASNRRTFGIAASVDAVWSSVSMTTTFGRA